MKKAKVLKHFPNLKVLTKEAATKAREGKRLTSEAEEAQAIVDELKGVVLHEDFPVVLREFADGCEVRSGCDEVTRSAYVKPIGGTGKYVVTTYRNDGSEVDGTPVIGEHPKKNAFNIAKGFVATGKKVSV